jgi:16S rRNA (uracil1498-N3)-methyltransferase
MIRCYLPANRWEGETAELDEVESKHVSGVMRVAAGTRIQILDGAGRRGEAEVLVAHKKHTTLRIVSQELVPFQPPRRILAQALVREQQMDWLIQKAVELGVHEIWPLQTEHAVVRLRPGEEQKKVRRWQAIALAACKQSGNPWMPIITPARKLTEVLTVVQREPGEACFGALQENAQPLVRFFERLHKENCPQVTMFIGPEGDFSSTELAALLAAGVQPVTFGPIVLRVETAAIFILSALQYAWME